MSIRAAVLLLLAFRCLCAAAQGAVAPEAEGKALPTYVRLVDGDMPEGSFDLSDSLFYKISGATFFKVNRHELNYQDRLVTELNDWIIPEARRQDWEIVGISLRGAASPEGPYEYNARLSKRRAKALTDFLIDRMGQSYQELMTVNTTAEDYRSLVLLMEESGDRDARRVRALLAQCKDDPRRSKSALMRADGGRLWKRLLREYFPRLRAARVVLFFKKKKPGAVPIEEIIPIDFFEKSDSIDTFVPVDLLEKFVRETPLELSRRHALAVGSNLLYDAFYMPRFGWAPMWNVELEYYPRKGKWTYLAAFTSPYYHRWGKNKFFQIRDYHIEARRYFKPGEHHTGLFLAAYINANIYGVGLSKKDGWQGEGAGAAAKAGYVLSLCRSGRWRIEACAAFGGYVTRYDPYVYGNPVTGDEDGDYYYDYTGPTDRFRKRNHQRTWLGPTEVGIKLRCDLLYRRIHKKGVSLKRKEAAR